MELPDNQFCRNLRGEMAPLHNQVMSNTLADAKGVATTCVDATPWEQKEYLGGPMQVDEKGGARRDWCGVGIVQIGDQAAKAEALAVKEGIFDQLRNSQVLLHKAYAAKYGEAAAAAALHRTRARSASGSASAESPFRTARRRRSRGSALSASSSSKT